MTKGGKCVLDKNELQDKFQKAVESAIDAKIDKVHQKNEDWRNKCNEVIRKNDAAGVELERQLRCGAKGHGKWVYQKLTTHYSPAKDGGVMKSLSCFVEPNGNDFVFKCSACNLEITKTAKELTATEKEGLTKLKLL